MSDSREDFEAVIRELDEKQTTAGAAQELIDKDKTTEVVTEPVVEKEEKDEEQEESLGEAVKKAAEPTSEAPAVEEEKALLVEDKAPASWSPKVREQWAGIPKEVRDEILRREDASAQGVRKLQEETAPMRGFVQQLDPFIREATQLGANPGQYIGQVMATERALRNPDENARFEALLNIADQYRIPLRQVINKSIGREVLEEKPVQAAIPAQVQQELEANRQWRAQQEEASMRREIDSFKVGKEFFNDVAPMMGDLLQANAASTLQEAYDKAIWAHPETREVLLARQGKQGAKDDVASRQAAAAKVSAKTNETIPVKTKKKGDQEEETSLEDDIREAFAAAEGRT